MSVTTYAVQLTGVCDKYRAMLGALRSCAKVDVVTMALSPYAVEDVRDAAALHFDQAMRNAIVHGSIGTPLLMMHLVLRQALLEMRTEGRLSYNVHARACDVLAWLAGDLQ